ncbi:MAG: ABC transporter permease [Defluviitaleaceae bacterium]|nr:ABC transporter permease [Defluviitaleaceae bacterium]
MGKAIILVNFFILAGCLGFLFYSYVVAGRYFAHDVIYIAPRTNESRLFFDVADVEILAISYPEYSFAPVSRSSARVASSTHEASATVINTNAAYFDMHAMDFIEGHRGTVINKALAWRLFGACEGITGLAITVNDVQHTVTGIVRQCADYTVWFSGEISAPVSSLYILAPDPLAESQARTMLETYLRGNSEYAVVDINRFVQSINIRHRILLYPVWATAFVIFLIRALKQKSALPLVGAMLCLIVLWGARDILFWLPNLSAPSTSLFTEITTIGALPPDVYLSAGMLRLSQLSRNANIALIAGAVGYVNLLFFWCKVYSPTRL